MDSLIAVVGPTASGKSDLALDIACALAPAPHKPNELVGIINADASQLYRGMDIGTAKIPVDDRRGIEHAQIDVLHVTDEASVAAYQRYACADVDRIAGSLRQPIVVGGSGLYVRAVTDYFEFPGTDRDLRRKIDNRVDAEGLNAVYRELERKDPESAQKIDSSNRRKIVRALEVMELTGHKFSASLPPYVDRIPTCHLAIRTNREGLNARIVRRAQAMFEGGLVEETERLLQEGLREGPTASKAIGYSQAIAVIDGVMNEHEAIEATAVATRKLASRQLKWFRRDPRITWLDLEMDEHGEVPDWAWEALVSQAMDTIDRRKR
ncbi:tRNA (adenosine(37)-N6)-dimethylallyltransferase MiaA [Actinomyces vulturis]|uniref:tRNA (adenosine(37)-N6)-dimethylallyltransferase MiaA n=1 Tax=Actinomyces vulturis TaxID=1857645 RepID=UPI0009F40003|nr:tRNA (adenosine(37)-N6)-dimethylallyltransferase MiaA [Actinomyces vulturis]